MPNCLISSYKQALEHHDVMEMAMSTEKIRRLIGGQSKEDTLQHFAMRYGVSVCRAESLVIDPKRAFASIPEDLIVTLSDGPVSILDVPCGTGAAGTSLLSTIAALRASNVIPKLPLTVKITGGDYSNYSLDIYKEIIASLTSAFRSVGIIVHFTPFLCDVRKPETTAALVDHWFQASENSEEFLAVIANFSGEAGRSFSEVKRSFEHIHERLHDKTSSVIWIEPEMKGAKTYLNKIKRLMESISWFTSSENISYEYEYKWFHPFQRRKLPCRIIVQRYVRT